MFELRNSLNQASVLLAQPSVLIARAPCLGLPGTVGAPLKADAVSSIASSLDGSPDASVPGRVAAGKDGSSLVAFTASSNANEATCSMRCPVPHGK